MCQGQADLARGEKHVGLGQHRLAGAARLCIPGALARVVLIVRALLHTQQAQFAVVEAPLAEQPALAVERLALHQVFGRVRRLQGLAHLGHAQRTDQQELTVRIADVHRTQGAIGTQVFHQHRQAIEARRQVVGLRDRIMGQQAQRTFRRVDQPADALVDRRAQLAGRLPGRRHQRALHATVPLDQQCPRQHQHAGDNGPGHQQLQRNTPFECLHPLPASVRGAVAIAAVEQSFRHWRRGVVTHDPGQASVQP